ncbi:hypothetical protein ACX9MO_19735 [Pseudooceanicola sp. 502str34]
MRGFVVVVGVPYQTDKPAGFRSVPSVTAAQADHIRREALYSLSTAHRSRKRQAAAAPLSRAPFRKVRPLAQIRRLTILADRNGAVIVLS